MSGLGAGVRRETKPRSHTLHTPFKRQENEFNEKKSSESNHPHAPIREREIHEWGYIPYKYKIPHLVHYITIE